MSTAEQLERPGDNAVWTSDNAPLSAAQATFRDICQRAGIDYQKYPLPKAEGKGNAMKSSPGELHAKIGELPLADTVVFTTDEAAPTNVIALAVPRTTTESEPQI